MSFRNFPLFRALVPSLHIDVEVESPLPPELDRELEDLRKLSLTLLMAFLTVHEISASNTLGAATLALLVYTINLHIAVNARFFRNSPVLSRFLHAVPLLGIFCMVIFKLVIVVRSPAVIATMLLACVLPTLVIIVLYLVRRYAGKMTMQQAAPVLPSSTSIPAVSS